METIRLKINFEVDRENLVLALANSGYKVWVEAKPREYGKDGEIYICFDSEINKKI